MTVWIAVLLGVIISIVNSLGFIFLSFLAMKNRITRAAAIIVASFIFRVTVVLILFLYLVNSTTWANVIYPLVVGFIIAQLLTMVVEVIVLNKLELMVLSSEGSC